MKKLDKIIIFSFLGAVVVALAAVPLSSYIEYNNYLDGIETPSSQAKEPKAVLQSIEAKLVEGKKFYANNLARVTNSDVVVTAHYTKGEEAYDETLEESKYSVSVPSTFALEGGDITVTFGSKKTTIAVELIPVEIESLAIVKQPYRIKYQQGSTFDAEGMQVAIMYNDGSSKTLDDDAYTFDTSKELTLADKKMTISYVFGEKTYTADVTISVVEVLNDGSITSIELADVAYVQSGDPLKNAEVDVLGIYESGNKKHLQASEYTIVADNTNAKMGHKYSIGIEYGEVKLTTPVVVRAHLEGENGLIVGGTTKTETEYVFENGVFTPLSNKVTFAGSFANAIKNGNESSLTFNVTSYVDVSTSLTMRCGNSYLVKDDNGAYVMKPLQINSIMDLTVNGEKYAIGDDVILKGCGPLEKTYAPLYGVYYEFSFENLNLSAGNNEIKFSFKNSYKKVVAWE